MVLSKIRIDYWDGIKILVLRDGYMPETYNDFVLYIASRIPAIDLAIQSYVLRLQYSLEMDGKRGSVHLEDDDDLLVMYESGSNYAVHVEVEEVSDTNRHRMVQRNGMSMEEVKRKLSYATPASSQRTLTANSSSDRSSTVVSSPASSVAPFSSSMQSPMSLPTPQAAPPAQSSVAPTATEWNLLVDSKRHGWWMDVVFDATKDQVHRVVEAWTIIKNSKRADEFALAVRENLMASNPAYQAHFPGGVPAMVILEGLVAHAHLLERGKGQSEVLAELIYLGARHIKDWKVGDGDLRLMVSAILIAVAALPNAPGHSKDLLAWRTVLCEMSAIMARGCAANEREVADVKREVDAARLRARMMPKTQKKDCIVM